MMSIIFKSIVHFVILIGILSVSPVQGQESIAGTGLEVDDYRSVGVIIEELTSDASEIGLTVNRIRTKVELRIRQAGLIPKTRSGEYLYVYAHVVGKAFSVTVEFHRFVEYKSGNKSYYTYGIVWHGGITGTHANSSEYLVGQIDQLMDQFLNEYLRTNGH